MDRQGSVGIGVVLVVIAGGCATGAGVGEEMSPAIVVETPVVESPAVASAGPEPSASSSLSLSECPMDSVSSLDSVMGSRLVIPEEQTFDTVDGEPQIEAFDHFEPIIISGRGSERIDLPELAWAGTVNIDFQGEGHFSICRFDVEGDFMDTLVNVTGPYVGTRAYGIDDRMDSIVDQDVLVNPSTGEPTQTGSFMVDSDEEWKLIIRSVRDVPQLAVPYQGAGDSVFFYSSGEWQTGVTITHEDSGQFAFVQYYSYALPGVEMNIEGPGKEEANLWGGTRIMIVRSEGGWRIE